MTIKFRIAVTSQDESPFTYVTETKAISISIPICEVDEARGVLLAVKDVDGGAIFAAAEIDGYLDNESAFFEIAPQPEDHATLPVLTFTHKDNYLVEINHEVEGVLSEEVV